MWATSNISNVVAIDTETTGLDLWHGDSLVAVGAVFPSGRTLYWRGEYSGLRQLLNDQSIDKVFQNAKFDIRVLEQAGFKVRGKVWDTMILCHLMDGRQLLALEHTSAKYLPAGRRKIVEEVAQWFEDNNVPKDSQDDFSQLPPDLLERRCVGDATLTLLLFAKLYPIVSTHFPLLLAQEHALISVVRKMEDRGITIDLDEIQPQADQLSTNIDNLQLMIEGVLGDKDGQDFNINSRAHLINLFQVSGIYEDIPLTMTHGKHGTMRWVRKMDDWALRAMHHPVAHMVLMMRACCNLRAKFLDQMESCSILAPDQSAYGHRAIIHPSYNQVGTCTGRMSCSNPNLMNIPIEGARRSAYTAEEAAESEELTGIRFAPHIKAIFVCRPGFSHIHCDKKRVELVMLAHYSGDPVLTQILESGADPHGELCQRMYGEVTKGLRTRTKIVIFGYCYGASDRILARNIGSDMATAHETKARLAAALPGLPAIRRAWYQQLNERGYVVTEHGRRHYLEPGQEYMVVNRMCQGTAADEVKSRMIALDDYFRAEAPECSLLLNIHDDLGIEAPNHLLPKVVGPINHIMNQSSIPFKLSVPATTEITHTRWCDLKEIQFNANGTPKARSIAIPKGVQLRATNHRRRRSVHA